MQHVVSIKCTFSVQICDGEDGRKVTKLGDFGLSMEVKKPIYTVCGTPTYVAPEILMERGYGLEVDMWALGVISYILLCGFPPFRSPQRRQSELFRMIKKGDFHFASPYWDNISARKCCKQLFKYLATYFVVYVNVNVNEIHVSKKIR